MGLEQVQHRKPVHQKAYITKKETKFGKPKLDKSKAQKNLLDAENKAQGPNSERGNLRACLEMSQVTPKSQKIMNPNQLGLLQLIMPRLIWANDLETS